MFKKIAPDKWRHFYTGIPMGAFLQGLGWWLFPKDLLLVTIIVFLAAVRFMNCGAKILCRQYIWQFLLLN